MIGTPASPRLRPVDLRVTDLAPAMAFWRDTIGLPVLESGDPVVLGFPGCPMIRLHAGVAVAMPDMALGLFHVALRVPTRQDLARVDLRFAASGRRHSSQDHLFSQSLYIADPDGNKIEITHLTPGRGTARVEEGRLVGVTNEGTPHSILEPLDLAALHATLPSGESIAGPLPEATANDHIHFRSRDLARSFDFYTRLVGLWPSYFAPVTGFSDSGSPGHPHLVALNTWAGDRLVEAPEGSAGMIACTLVLPAPEAAAARLRAEGIIVSEEDVGLACTDPDGNRLQLAAA